MHLAATYSQWLRRSTLGSKIPTPGLYFQNGLFAPRLVSVPFEGNYFGKLPLVAIGTVKS